LAIRANHSAPNDIRLLRNSMTRGEAETRQTGDEQDEKTTKAHGRIPSIFGREVAGRTADCGSANFVEGFKALGNRLFKYVTYKPQLFFRLLTAVRERPIASAAC